MASEPLKLDGASTALIIQDMQNDTITEGGAFSDSGAPAHAKSQGAVEHVVELAAACRERGVPVIEKMRMNAFHGTRLEPLLRGLQVKTILISGAWTNMSIEHTARHGADAGFEVVVVSDGTATISEEWQAAALNYALTRVGQSLTSAELIAA